MRWTHREQPAQCYMISIKPITHRMSVHISVRDCTTPQRTARACPQGCKPPQEDLVQTPDQLRTPEAPRGSRMQPSLPHAALHHPTPCPIEAPGHHLSHPATGRLWARSPRVQDFCFLLWLPSSTSIASLLPLQTMHTN